jgi:hypothetical protein
MRRLFKKYVPFDQIALFVVFCCCLVLWQATYHQREKWPGIPPAPDAARAEMYGFGDTQLSYRNIGLMLQNAGDEGGRVTNLALYDYRIIHGWLWLTYALDPHANYVPSLAAYYFGATPDHKEQAYLVDYLAKEGETEGFEKWRWLAHAVYLARFEMKDQIKALELADRLAALKDPDMPIWTKQMPAFVLSKVGRKKAARDLMLTIAATTKNIDPNEINETCWYIEHNLREPDDNLDKDQTWNILCAHNPAGLEGLIHN